MKETRKLAKNRLKQSTRAEFARLIYEAKLTPRQEEIINLRFLQGYSVCKIALSLSYCESLIRKELTIAYDKIAFL